jgi:hypothetical protein
LLYATTTFTLIMSLIQIENAAIVTAVLIFLLYIVHLIMHHLYMHLRITVDIMEDIMEFMEDLFCKFFLVKIKSIIIIYV